MVVDIILIVSFLAGGFAFWYRLSLKIPELIAIPDQVITERLEEDSAGIQLFLLRIRTYYREGKHKQVFWSFLGKTFYRIHLLLMRMDNRTVVLLKKIRTHGGIVNGNGGSGNTTVNSKEYWQKLQEPQERASPLTSKSRIIEEVRKKE